MCVKVYNEFGHSSNVDLCHLTTCIYNPDRYQCTFGAPLWNCAILTPNSQICVALMVSAPIYVRKSRCHTYGTPENKIGAFGWGISLKQRNTRNVTRKTPKMIVVPPGK